ncbi:MAG TPA: TadE/TadG family type IV pilus assembly protein [Acidimicrobiales bacterium]|nr:TadE/TadG family type IV pilus assembly protein [Acidimicrobiales bacterium]
MRARAARDDGVAVVEMALVLPVLLVLMLGMFTGAMAWNQSQAVGQGARVAARYASTLPLPTPVGAQTQAQANEVWLDGLIDRAVAASEGELGAAVSGRVVCVAYVDPAGTAITSDDKTIRRQLTGASTRSAVDAQLCFTDSQGDGDKRVQVLVTRDGHIDTGFYRIPITIRRTVVYRYEADGGL